MIPIGLRPDGEIDYFPISCITCAIDELGTFLNPADKELVDALTSLWDSKLGIWDKKTKTQGEDIIENPWINVIACTTPAWIHNHFTEDLIGGGLASRTLFVYAEEKRRLIAYPSSAIDMKTFEEQGAELLEDLKLIALMQGEYVLDGAAVRWGEEWYEKHWAQVPTHMTSDRFGGYVARKQTHIHKTAIVLAAAESDNLIIERSHLVAADNYVTGLEQAMHKVFEKVGESSTSKNVKIMLNFLQAYGEINEQRLWYNCMNQMTGREFKRSLADGITAGMIGSRNVSGTLFLSRKEPKQ
jgi:hypothetical protein